MRAGGLKNRQNEMGVNSKAETIMDAVRLAHFRQRIVHYCLLSFAVAISLLLALAQNHSAGNPRNPQL